MYKAVFQDVLAVESKRQRDEQRDNLAASASVDPVAAAIMRAQLSVFEEQFASLHQSMRSCAQLTGVDPLNPSAPPDARYLQQSEGSSNAPKAADGVAVLAPDGLEIKLANHLDAQGGLAKAQQVESFLQLCAKAASPERQALLLAVLQCTTGTMQLARFVQLGGLKVLRGWLRDAAMSNHTQLTGLVLDVLRELPVTEEAVRVSEIGKAVKKIRKQSPEAETATPATEDDSAAKDAVASRADALISMWMRVLKDQRTAPAAAPARAAATEPPRKRARPPLPLSETAAAAEARRVRREALAAAAGSTDSRDARADIGAVSASKDSGDVLGSLMGISSAKPPAPAPAPARRTPDSRATKPSNSTRGSLAPADAGGAPWATDDMEEDTSSPGLDLPQLASFEAMTGSSAAAPKKSTRPKLRWADDEGHALFEKVDYVTEYMRRAEEAADAAAEAAAAAQEQASATDLSHRDRMRREVEKERAAVKQAHESVAREKAQVLEERRTRLRSMAPRRAWTRPRPLVLAQADESAFDSKEVEQQNMRTQRIEAVQFSDSVPPPNPDATDPSLAMLPATMHDVIPDIPLLGAHEAPQPVMPMENYGVAPPMQQMQASLGQLVEVCRRMVNELGLEMSVISAEFSPDGSKVTYYYRSMERVDHRELVRNLHATTRLHIWMTRIN